MTGSEVSINHLFRQSSTRHLKRIIQLAASIENGRGKRTAKSVDRVHDLRTETRRADIGLRIFADWLPDHAVNKMRKTLTKLRADAGEVRDLDVLIEFLNKPDQRLSTVARNWLSEQAETTRSDAMQALQQRCRQVSNRRIKSRVQSLKDRLEWRGSSSTPDASQFAEERIQQRGERLFSKAESLKLDDKQMHPVRIRARQLRYTLDSLSDVLAQSTSEPARQMLTEIQQELGTANDELFVIEFLKSVTSECEDPLIAAELQQTIRAREDLMADQINAAIHAALSRIERLRELLLKKELIAK